MPSAQEIVVMPLGRLGLKKKVTLQLSFHTTTKRLVVQPSPYRVLGIATHHSAVPQRWIQSRLLGRRRLN